PPPPYSPFIPYTTLFRSKVMLSLRERKIPPSLHFNRANPRIDFDNGPFYVNTRLTRWAVRAGQQRFAAINSLGYSGTNCHVVVGDRKSTRLNSSHDQISY